MQLFPIKKIQYDSAKLSKIKNITESSLRLITYSRNHLADDLLNAYISKITSFQEQLSIKNAQLEAQSVEEAKQYVIRLNIALDFITNEIKESNAFNSEVQLFQLFRLISPESHAVHPNKYRNSLVKVGRYLAPEPIMVPNLVSELFYNINQIDNTIIKALYFHHELIRIHPFNDGNGRTIRMAKNWMLMYELYSPIFISGRVEKKKYVHALESSFMALDSNPDEWNIYLDEFFNQELERLLNNTLSVYEFVKKEGVKRDSSRINIL